MSYQSILAASALPAQVPRSDTESARFGVEFGRLELGPRADVTAEELRALIEESPLDVVVVRYPAAWVTMAAALHVAGRRTHHADTLMYYRCDLGTPDVPKPDGGEPEVREPSLPHGFTTQVATRADGAVLEQLVRETFDRYGSHYSTNPLCAPDAIVDGYVEWALHAAFETPETSALFALDAAGTPQGFAVTSEGSCPELVLGGVRTEVRRRGVYNGMLAARRDRIALRARNAFYASTQAHNLRPQRAWVGLGFHLDLVMNTVHVTKSELLARG